MSAESRIDSGLMIRRAILISLFAGLLVSIFKFIGYYATGSAAILSDALESVVNVVAALFALLAIEQSRKKADNDHHYGHGRYEYLSAGFEGGLIVIAGGLILFEAGRAFLHPVAPEALRDGFLWVLVATIVNAALAWYLLRTARRFNSPALEGDGHHVASDVITSAGVLVGLIIAAWSGIVWVDPLIALLLGCWILYTGIRLLRRSLGKLLDEVDPTLVDLAVAELGAIRRSDMIRPHRMRMREMGAGLMIDLHLVIPRYYTVDIAHDIETYITRELRERLDRPVDLLLHTDPCEPSNCPECPIARCKVRSERFRQLLPWDPELLLSDISHPAEDEREQLHTPPPALKN